MKQRFEVPSAELFTELFSTGLKRNKTGFYSSENTQVVHQEQEIISAD